MFLTRGLFLEGLETFMYKESRSKISNVMKLHFTFIYVFLI